MIDLQKPGEGSWVQLMGWDKIQVPQGPRGPKQWSIFCVYYYYHKLVKLSNRFL